MLEPTKLHISVHALHRSMHVKITLLCDSRESRYVIAILGKPTPRNKTVICISGLFHQLGNDRKATRLGMASGNKPDFVFELVGKWLLARIKLRTGVFLRLANDATGLGFESASVSY